MAKRIAIYVALPLIIVVGVVISMRFKTTNHDLVLKAFFRDAQGLSAGDPVRLAGVEIGKVTSVRVNPANQEIPAEVVMLISTPYEIKIPNDSKVVVERTGLLAGECVSIKIEGTSGPEAASGAILKTQPEPANANTR